MAGAASASSVQVEGCEATPLDSGWEAARVAPGSFDRPEQLDGITWLPARVPGTAAAALAAAGIPAGDLDADDWWFRTRFQADPAGPGEEVVLNLGGIATVCELFLNGERLLDSDSMFAAHALDVSELLRRDNELALHCRALEPLLGVRRKPRARWRTRLVSNGNLRFFRTTLLGRAPGFARGPAPVGPWRPISLERRRVVTVEELVLRPRIEGADGVLSVRARLRALATRAPEAAEVELSGPSGTHAATLELVPGGDGTLSAVGEIAVPSVERWWPHTHGVPALHSVRLSVTVAGAPTTVAAARVGFRTLAPGGGSGHDLERDGLDLHVNGVRVFARGAVWTPADPVGLAPAENDLREQLERVVAAGMNIVRLPGVGVYESDAFHDLCDELGVLVWQDFMFANLDYPIADEHFRATVEREARDQLARIGHRPSLAVICGNSEVEQQVAMMGLDPELGRGELFGELLPALVAESGTRAPYVPSAPCGGDLPFRPGRGIANYYGVGAYLRPLEDARRAGVRFAAECLAFANVPDDAAIDGMLPGAPGALVVHHPRWKEGVPRDVGAGWDFEDVRDHYLRLLFGVDPVELRRVDHERYLELSRAVSGEVMAEVFGEWRRTASPCGGGMVLWLRDLEPGAGWGVLDHRGEPKVAYHHLRRALAPVSVWTVDEGLGGVAVHVANDRSEPLQARLRVVLYRDFEQQVGEASEELVLDPHGAQERGVEELLGHFVDAAWAYGFGPPAQDLIVASLERDGELLAQALRFPAGRPPAAEPAARIGMEATVSEREDGALLLEIASRRLAYGVRVQLSGYVADDDAFSVEPGGRRSILLCPRGPGPEPAAGALTALNMQGRVSFRLPAAG